MAPTTDDDELLTFEEAADVLGVGVQRMYNLRNLGHGPVSYRRGRRLVYPRSGLVAFLARELQATLKSGEERESTSQAHANGRGLIFWWREGLTGRLCPCGSPEGHPPGKEAVSRDRRNLGMQGG